MLKSIYIISMMFLASIYANAQVTEVIVFAEPQDIIGCEGEENRITAVSANAESGTTLYRWYKDGMAMDETVDFPNPTNESGLLFSNLSHEDSGIYKVHVWSSNDTEADAFISRDITVYVQQAPVIINHPMNVTTDEGGMAEMSVEAHIYGNNINENNPYNIEIQWQIYDATDDEWDNLADNEIISGANSSLIKIKEVPAALFGAQVRVMLSGYCGDIYSNAATIEERPMVTIGGLTDLASLSGDVCGGTELTVEASATVSSGENDLLTYQWYDQGMAINGATSKTLTVTVQDGVNHEISYEVNYTGMANYEPTMSSVAAVYGVIAPSITMEPMSVEAEEGTSASFSVMADGDDLSYEWFNSSSTMSIASGSTLSFDNLEIANSGTYYAVVSNQCGEVTSMMAELTVTTSEAPLSVLDTKEINLVASPNPFTQNSTIRFNVIGNSDVQVTLIDVAGNTIANLLDGRVSGPQELDVNSDALSLSQGTYFYIINIDGRLATKQLIFVK